MALLVVIALIGATISPAQSEFVIAREGTKDYHRPGCALIRDGSGALAMTRAQAEARGLKAHAECDPANAPAAQTDGKGTKGSPASSKPALVLLDGSSYYHRDKCAKLKTETTRVSLEAAARKHWPCRTCKPPIRPKKGF